MYFESAILRSCASLIAGLLSGIGAIRTLFAGVVRLVAALRAGAALFRDAAPVFGDLCAEGLADFVAPFEPLDLLAAGVRLTAAFAAGFFAVLFFGLTAARTGDGFFFVVFFTATFFFAATFFLAALFFVAVLRAFGVTVPFPAPFPLEPFVPTIRLIAPARRERPPDALVRDLAVAPDAFLAVCRFVLTVLVI